jgi:hypothetical protein
VAWVKARWSCERGTFLLCRNYPLIANESHIVTCYADMYTPDENLILWTIKTDTREFAAVHLPDSTQHKSNLCLLIWLSTPNAYYIGTSSFRNYCLRKWKLMLYTIPILPVTLLNTRGFFNGLWTIHAEKIDNTYWLALHVCTRKPRFIIDAIHSCLQY